tara:strand:+ start:976 stop:2055 length:1080 start_codon:yes stop_codon:yes gene_type:complete
MKIDLKQISIRDLTIGYEDNDEEGVYGYNGKLDIRPPYQRNFIYPEKQRNAVIDTVSKGFPLNVMYWATREDGTFEVIDGQQRIISICMYVNGDYSVNDLAFHNLASDKQKQILDYPLTVYFCTGTDSEKLEWFKTINIAGEKLEQQELRNAVYSGPWVTSAKRYFSKINGVAYNLGGDYLDGSANRQHYLETVIKWISEGKIESYMSENQHSTNAEPLWNYFKDVISWIEKYFKNKKIMKGIDWGLYYNKYKDKTFDPTSIDTKTKELILDDEITKKKGIYPYLITGEEKHLSLRSFTDSQKLKAHQIQGGKCKICNEPFDISQMEADHIEAWSSGGKTIIENCQMLCTKDHKLLKNK